MAYSIATSASHHTLNESPSEKEGKLFSRRFLRRHIYSLNESPSEKEGKFGW